LTINSEKMSKKCYICPSAEPDPSEIGFKKELAVIINRHSYDSRLNIPDFLIAEHLIAAMSQLEETTKRAAEWGSNFLSGLESTRRELGPIEKELFKKHDTPTFDELFRLIETNNKPKTK